VLRRRDNVADLVIDDEVELGFDHRHHHQHRR
jgi:hypothetical protein